MKLFTQKENAEISHLKDEFKRFKESFRQCDAQVARLSNGRTEWENAAIALLADRVEELEQRFHTHVKRVNDIDLRVADHSDTARILRYSVDQIDKELGKHDVLLSGISALSARVASLEEARREAPARRKKP